MRISLPNNWTPRDYQMPAWNYLEKGGKHAELIWHRRSGKDEIALHRTAIAAHERPATYWHMLPLATQVRKAIWNAINPHTGTRRIDEAFPHELRANTNDQEMFIRFKNGSTWQALGSDNYDAMVGSPPAGIVYSEWALANPSARGYLRPILAENNGWQIFITTPRGKNHAHRTYLGGVSEPATFAQVLTVADTKIISEERLEVELREYVDTYGEDQGKALYEQEYFCSFEAAILGAYYSKEITVATKEGRIAVVDYDPNYPVYAACDIGRADATAFWLWQVVGGEPRIIESLSASGKDPDWFISQLTGVETRLDNIDNQIVVVKGDPIKGLEHRTKYEYKRVMLPHDGKAKTFAARGKSAEELFAAEFGWTVVGITPNLSRQDGIQAGRKLLGRCAISKEGCAEGMDALSQYQHEWDDEKKMFRDTPKHDWTSHYADGWRYMAVCWSTPYAVPEPENKPIIGMSGLSLEDLWEESGHNQRSKGRI